MLIIQHPPIQSDISAVSFAGLSITTPDGRAGKLAIIDENGRVIEAGNDIAAAAWNAAILAYRNFMIGKGHLRVHTSPPEGFTPSKTTEDRHEQ